MTEITVSKKKFWRAVFSVFLIAPAVLLPLAFVWLIVDFVLGGHGLGDTSLTAPLLVFFVALVSIGSTILGAPIYLSFGTVVLWQCAKRFRAHPLICALAGFTTNAALFGVAALLTGSFDDLIGFYFQFGAFFAPLWGFCFGLKYRPEKRASVLL